MWPTVQVYTLNHREVLVSHHMLCQEGRGREGQLEEEREHSLARRLCRPGSQHAAWCCVSPHPACSGFTLRHTRAALPDDSRPYMLTILAVTVVLWLSIQYFNASTGRKSYWELHTCKPARANDSPRLQVSSKWSPRQSKISTHNPSAHPEKAGEAKTEAVP